MSTSDPFLNDRLYCPGPTPVPEIAKLAALEGSVYHRTESFAKTFLECRKLLQPIVESQEAPLILTCSGTGAMEAALCHVTCEGDPIIAVNAGKFGERWKKIGESFGCQVTELKVPWGQTPTAQQMKDVLRTCPDAKAVFLQANETSTASKIDVESLAKAVREESSARIVVDAISSLGAHPMRMTSWDIDCVVAGSQKGFGVPPGLAFIALSPETLAKPTKRGRFYLDLQREADGQRSGKSACTPATTLVLMLHRSLQEIHRMGIERLLRSHVQRANAVRAAMSALGLPLFAKSSPSDALTAITLPESIDAVALRNHLRDGYRMTFAGGQSAATKPTMLRFSHLGFIDRFDVLAGICGLEFALADLGGATAKGLGVSAAMAAFQE